MKYDLVIMGGGPGGYVAAIYAAKNNVSVALVEKDALGGTCLNRGCIPTKALIHCAKLYKTVQNAGSFAITARDVSYDWKGVQSYKSKTVQTLCNGIGTLLKKNGVDVYTGVGKLTDRNSVRVDGDTMGETICADNIIIATGSSPVGLPIPGTELDGVVSSNKALSFDEVPESMLIIGGGVIGIELGYIYNSFGTDITVIEIMPQILPGQDKEIALTQIKILEKQGIKIRTNSKVLSIEKSSDKLKVNFDSHEGQKYIVVEKVLISVGRKPNLNIFDGLSMETGSKGVIVDEYLRTSIPGIYAIGDVTGESMLAHVASHQGIVAVKNILTGPKTKMNYKVVPACIYTSPEIASVGYSEEEARAVCNDDILIGRFSLPVLGKAVITGETEGFVKIIADKKWNEILGVHIIAPQATELIGEVAVAMQLESTAEKLADIIHAHPTLSEALPEAASDLLGKPIHKL